ncbi:glutathione synthetase-like isoform X2 [Ischnura elegans]|uniref:glutathione synthetase-like isoform X2 n=1 Tax=Ischnura elegans TaxID=197161 RepID=UPI001ED88BFA|nr:glutathione synthetase-like isoform X2 [Ischnura elegans]
MEIPRLEPCIPLPLEDSVLEDLVDKAKDWAIMNGAGMRSKLKFSKNELHFAPFMLLPSTFPKREFEKAVAIQPILNELMHKVAHSYEFLSESLKSTIEVDDFTKRLFQIYETVRKEGFTQSVSLGLLRSDYLHNCATDNIKQVEINTIASSFAGISVQITDMNRYVLQELGHADLLPHLPENNALQGLCGGMIEAWKLYGKPESVILFVVEDITYNICDQRFHEFEIRKMEPKVRVIRRTLTDLGKRSTLTEEKILMIDGLEVAVVYYRSGYAPTQYHSELEWEARLKVERSLSIKCPSIQYHLAGTKRVQQALASPAVLERFLDSSVAASVREIFTGLYTLDLSDEGNAAVEMALKNPTHYVLKPQREGGGNNVYGEEVKLMLEKMGNSNERSAWILMERIIPPVQRCYLIHPNSDTPVYTDVVSELGIFGVIIGDEKVILKNSQVGHMLRTKVATANEGGVAAGYGALDSPFLVEMKSCCHPIIQN